MCLVALLGVVASALSAHVHYKTIAAGGGYDSFCTFSAKADCTVVAMSPQSRVMGTPIAVWGILTYSALFALNLGGLFRSVVWFERSLLLTTAGGLACVLYSVYLGYIIVFVIQRHCVLCYALYGVNVLLLILPPVAARYAKADLVGAARRDMAYLARRPRLAGAVAAVGLFSLVGAYGIQRAERNRRILGNPQIRAICDGTAKRIHFAMEAVPTRGPEEAPVTIIEFSDFQCEFCRLADMSLSQVCREFPGQVRQVFVNLPIDQECNPHVSQTLHPGSCRLARAGRIFFLHGKFWEFKKMAFDHLGLWDDPQEILRISASLGVPPQRYERLMNEDPTLRASVSNEITASVETLGIARTPSFMVNGMLLGGNVEPWLWRRIIRLEIERASGSEGGYSPQGA